MTYLFAGMDTTINAIGHAIWLFAREPEQWRALCADPSLAGPAFEEVLRLESPVQGFARTARRDVAFECGTPQRRLNNAVRGLAALPTTVVPAT